ncbi:translation initiation factor IF-2 [Candidatus Aerophobetes bacterium]|uniref:Translation initiation factor IF-2 n=1 Tax=Aerophobetes bacterium TaxID=2030807 RepID=A0A523TBW2_UNCAE|nr:MAG: translation initiation factor IF-2 [Candidatus Aerophobetes bacterium]
MEKMRVYQLARKLKMPTKDLLSLISEMGIEVKGSLGSLSPQEVSKIEEKIATRRKPTPREGKEVIRDPVVTFLGHVDHGKTSLLDGIRKTHVAKREVGGITQSIGASEVIFQNKRIVFIDTPGHEAFTAMRAHGARVTDIVVLVVAADDGVMPQTIEAIDHARAAKVPIVVAINKIDLGSADSDQVKRQLGRFDLSCEEWGGETICVEVSALTGEGLDHLLEMILLEAEMLELLGNPEGDFQGVLIEGEMDKQKGAGSTLLVREGILRIGDILIGDHVYGKVKAMINWKGGRLKEAGLSTPVKVLGLSDVGHPGGIFKKARDEKEARRLAEQALEEERKKNLWKRKEVTLETLYQEKKEEKKTLNLIIKTDTQGSLQALGDVLKNLENENVRINITHGGIGEINKSDVLLASASKGIVISFNVGISGESRNLAKEENVEVRQYEVIYEIIDDIKKAQEALVEPKYEEVIIGKAEVRDTFRITRVGVIAGSYVTEGKVVRGSKARVFRGSEMLGEGTISSLKRFERDVSEVSVGLECGVNIEGFNEVEKGDIIHIYEARKAD